MQNRIRGDAVKTTMICVDSYENGVLNQKDECHRFESPMRPIVVMEHILDSANDPQSFTVLCSFAGMQRRQ